MIDCRNYSSTEDSTTIDITFARNLENIETNIFYYTSSIITPLLALPDSKMYKWLKISNDKILVIKLQ